MLSPGEGALSLKNMLPHCTVKALAFVRGNRVAPTSHQLEWSFPQGDLGEAVPGRGNLWSSMTTDCNGEHSASLHSQASYAAVFSGKIKPL